MTINIDEHFESRFGTTGKNPSFELKYIVVASGVENNDVDVRNAIGAFAPTSYDPFGTGLITYPRNDIFVGPVGDELWEAICYFGPVQGTGGSTYSFDTGGGTQHIDMAKSHVNTYPASEPNYGGLIGVTNDGKEQNVEGIDLLFPAYQFSETHFILDSFVDLAYKATLMLLTGSVNSDIFMGFAIGEVLFLGASGTKRGNGADWEINYRFAVKPNIVNQTVLSAHYPSGIVFSKRGWDYFWIRPEPIPIGGYPTPQPKSVHTEQVYPYLDLNDLFPWI